MSRGKSKPLFFRGKWRRKAWAGAKKAARRTWGNHRKNAKSRRTTRRSRRALVREWRQAFRSRWQHDHGSGDFFSRGRGRADEFWAHHFILADWKDSFAQRGHELLDKRELRSGVITQEELDALAEFDGSEQWRLEMARRRSAKYRAQRERDRDIEHGPLAMVYGGGHSAGLPKVKHVGFRLPVARPTVLKPSQPPTWQQPKRRVRRVLRKNRVNSIVKQWKPQLVQNARNAMAADGDLSAALQSLYNFAEQFPETRSQVHESLGKLAEFGKGYSSAMASYRQTLAQGKGEDNPGLPPEVLVHMQPLEEVGEQIVAASMAVIAAWEDYFQDAIKAAKDEHTPSKQALNS